MTKIRWQKPVGIVLNTDGLIIASNFSNEVQNLIFTNIQQLITDEQDKKHSPDR
jgi:hypothetical protein